MDVFLLLCLISIDSLPARIPVPSERTGMISGYGGKEGFSLWRSNATCQICYLKKGSGAHLAGGASEPVGRLPSGFLASLRAVYLVGVRPRPRGQWASAGDHLVWWLGALHGAAELEVAAR